MVDPTTYDIYSIPLEDQMRRISLVGPRFLAVIHSAQVTGSSDQLISEATNLWQELAGRPGDGALEVYRDLDDNLQSTRSFISRWQDVTDPASKHVIEGATETRQELERMRDLVSSTPPPVMAEIKRRLTDRYGTDSQKYDFRGSSAVMAAIVIGFALLRYFEIITLSWWLVWPLGLGAALIAASLISTIIRARR